MKKCKTYLTVYKTPKRALARLIGINETTLYFFLDPAKYPDKSISQQALAAIAKFEGVSVAKIREEYEARKAAA